jgi:hypothetical protein
MFFVSVLCICLLLYQGCCSNTFTFDKEVKHCVVACFVKFVDYVFRTGGLYVHLNQLTEMEMKPEMKQGTL